jgi:hypothetical protein
MQKVEKSGPSSSSTEYRNFCRRKLRHHRSVRQRWHGMTPGMEGRDNGLPLHLTSLTSGEVSRGARALSVPWLERPTPATFRLPPV